MEQTAVREKAEVAIKPSETAGRRELKLELVELRARGWSYRKIARQLQISKSTAAAWSKDLDEEIATLKAIELEALYETYYLLKEGRIRLLGAILRKLKREISHRDFSDVSTDKLLELLLKYQDALQEEYVEPQPHFASELPDKAGTKLDAEAIAEELASLLQRHKAGLIGSKAAKEELALLVAMLKAEEQTIIEEKLERLEAILAERGNGRR
jgi:transcriptional regulator with XRE-family HTH domain